MKAETRPMTVLYVEDEETDVFFMNRAFTQAAPELRLKTVTDGQQAVEYLGGQDGYADREAHPVPSLVLLDLKLPVLSGFDVLAWMRKQPPLQKLPVVILSSSAAAQDKQRAEMLGANGYVQKPSSGLQYREIVGQLKRTWLAEREAA